MFRFFKRKRYENQVKIWIITMFGGTGHAEKIFKTLRHKRWFSDHWKQVIEEGVELGNPPELIAATLNTIYWRDMITNIFTPEDVAAFRETIINHDHSDGALFPFGIKTGSLIVLSKNTFNISDDARALWFRDIHRAIFNDDDTHLDDTIEYLEEAVSKLRKYRQDKIS